MAISFMAFVIWLSARFGFPGGTFRQDPGTSPAVPAVRPCIVGKEAHLRPEKRLRLLAGEGVPARLCGS